MNRVKCPKCGEEHDPSQIEPSFDRPDAWFQIPKAERADRTWDGGTACMLRETDSAPRRHFLRVVLPVKVRAEPRTYSWGVWVEVSETDFDVAMNRWEDPEQANEPPFRGVLANELPDMPPTLGLEGAVQLVSPHRVPDFVLDPGSDHPLALEQHHGVFPERLVEWSMRAVHGSIAEPPRNEEL